MRLNHVRVRLAFVFVIQIEEGMDSLGANVRTIYFHIARCDSCGRSGFHVLLVDLMGSHRVRAALFKL